MRAAWLYSHPRRGTCFPECPAYLVCHCGCGCAAPVYDHNDKTSWRLAGEPAVFIHGHGGRPNLVQAQGLSPGGEIVPRSRVVPLLIWLIEKYGSQQRVADLLDYRAPAVCALLRGRRSGVRPETAKKLVELVMTHRTGRSFLTDEEDTRRLPTAAERRERRPFDAEHERQRQNTRARRAS